MHGGSQPTLIMKNPFAFLSHHCDNQKNLSSIGSDAIRHGVLAVLLFAVCTSVGLASCTATRVVTTTASYVQHGDTTTTIMTKTTEKYDASKKL